MTIHISVRFPPAVADAIDRASKEAGRTRSQSILRYVRWGLAKEKIVVEEGGS